MNLSDPVFLAVERPNDWHVALARNLDCLLAESGVRQAARLRDWPRVVLLELQDRARGMFGAAACADGSLQLDALAALVHSACLLWTSSFVCSLVAPVHAANRQRALCDARCVLCLRV